MGKLQILVLDDEPIWQETLEQVLKKLGQDTKIAITSDHATALIEITNNDFDLAIVDLSLKTASIPQTDNELGLEFIRELRRSRHNHGCGVIVFTGHATTRRVRDAFREFLVLDFLEKTNFDQHEFLSVVRKAILEVRLQRTEFEEKRRYRLTVTFGSKNLIGTSLVGPDRRTEYVVEHYTPFDASELTERADGLNQLILQGLDEWRKEADQIGRAIYRVLAEDKGVFENLIRAQEQAHNVNRLWIQFKGPVECIGIPFELLRDKNDYLSLTHILTRSITQAGLHQAGRLQTFHAFIRELIADRNKLLRILIVGSNSDGKIPSAIAEAEIIARDLERELNLLGIPHDIKSLLGEEATRSNFIKSLQSARYHIMHYAGHGRFDDQLPEVSDLVLHDSEITANYLCQLAAQSKELRLVYLSCCLGARTAASLGRGDFHGIFDALSKGGVPNVIGYRWMVNDESALTMARAFYGSLWRTFSPGEALFQARSSITLEQLGRDDETWASPVLLMQNC